MVRLRDEPARYGVSSGSAGRFRGLGRRPRAAPAGGASGGPGGGLLRKGSGAGGGPLGGDGRTGGAVSRPGAPLRGGSRSLRPWFALRAALHGADARRRGDAGGVADAPGDCGRGRGASDCGGRAPRPTRSPRGDRAAGLRPSRRHRSRSAGGVGQRAAGVHVRSRGDCRDCGRAFGTGRGCTHRMGHVRDRTSPFCAVALVEIAGHCLDLAAGTPGPRGPR